LTEISNEAKGTFGYVAFNPQDNQIVVAFRGSVNIANWVSNLDFIMKPFPGIANAQVHRGFYEAF